MSYRLAMLHHTKTGNGSFTPRGVRAVIEEFSMLNVVGNKGE